MQKINLKKTTKEQMLNMLETAWQANAGANEEIAALSKRIEEQNDALAKCVAEKNELRDQAREATGNAEYWHARFNNAYNVTEVQRQRIKEDADELRREHVNVETMTDQRNAALAESKDLRTKLADAEAALGVANGEMAALRHDLTCEQELSVHLASVCRWLSDHPWRNLWAWGKRKLGCAE
jgi:hypothetical protein|nr:MAG TPA: hypothetical protein [Caudoviricetes sp.]